MRPAVAAPRFHRLVVVFPVFWLLGLAPLFWVVAAIWAGLSLITVRTPRCVVTHVSALSALVAVALLISIPLGLAGSIGGSSRAVSAAVLAGQWLLFGEVLRRYWNNDERWSLLRALLLVSLFHGLLVVALVLGVPWPQALPLQTLPSGLPGIDANPSPLSESWFGGPVLRASGIQSNPTWSGAFGAVSLALGLRSLLAGRDRLLAGIVLLGSVFVIWLSYARAVWVATLFAVAVGVAVLLSRYFPRTWLAALHLIPAAVLSVLLLWWSEWTDVWSRVDSVRQGSSDSREAIYAATIELLAQHPLPLLGWGIKPEVGELVASVGSHSTYLGLAHRGGILGLGLAISLLACVIVLTVRFRDALALAAASGVALWAVFEDLDAGHFVLVALACLVATIPGNSDGADVGQIPDNARRMPANSRSTLSITAKRLEIP